jgi:hypothetical protein
MILTLKEIRRLICEEMDISDTLYQHEKPSDVMYDVEVSEPYLVSYETMAMVGETIVLTSNALFEEVENDSENKLLAEFVKEFISEASKIANMYDTTTEGQISSAIAAAEYFESNLERFSPRSQNLARISIDIVRNNIYESESAEISQPIS